VACLALALAVATFPGRTAPLRLAAVQRRPAEPHGARVLPVAVVVVTGALAGLLALGPAGAVVGAAGAVTCRNMRARVRRDRAAAATSAALAAALDRIVEELRSGAHPTTALQGAATDRSATGYPRRSRRRRRGGRSSPAICDASRARGRSPNGTVSPWPTSSPVCTRTCDGGSPTRAGSVPRWRGRGPRQLC
jgi:tight adherence protein B